MPIQDFVADFACREARLVIEVDGGRHALAKPRDEERDARLATAGYLVLRFWNSDVLSNTDGVVHEIVRGAGGTRRC